MIEPTPYLAFRFWLHFSSAITFVFALSILMRALNHYLIRHSSVKECWVPNTLQQTLINSALIVFAFSTLRESWDVSRGQSLFKAGLDYFSWLLGTGMATWGLHRWYYFGWDK